MSSSPRSPRVRIRYVGGDAAGDGQPPRADPRPGETAASGGYRGLKAAVARTVAGRDWRPRALLAGLLGWFTLRYLGDFNYAGPHDPANLVLHEAGHLLFMWSGSDLLTAAGGTLFNLAVPLLLAWMFWRQGDAFAVPVCLWWAGTVMVTAAPYVADARLMVLPTVTVGPGPGIHDWNFILGELGLLERHRGVAGSFRTAGLAMLIAAMAGCVWVVHLMRTTEPPHDEGADPASGSAPGRTMPEEGLEPPTRGL